MARPPKALVVLTGPPHHQDLPQGVAALRQLESVANRPLLAHVLDQIGESRIEEVGLVVGREGAEQVRAVVQDGSAWGLHARYVLQEEPFGPGDAVLAAEGFLEDGPFLVLHGDCVLDTGIDPLLGAAASRRLDALVAVRSRPSKGVGEPDGKAGERLDHSAALPLRLLMEAAAIPAIAFGPAVLAALRGLRPSWRGQIELTDAIEGMLGACAQVELRHVMGWRFDGTVEDLLRGNRMLLDRLATAYTGPKLGDSEVDGRVMIDPSARVEASVVRGPAIVGPGAQVIDSYVGPYSAIGAGAIIDGAEVEDSIVGEGAVVAKLGRRLAASVLGPGARLSRDFALSDAVRVSLGARAEIAMS